MNQCPWIPEMLYRFGDMHLLFDDALGKDGKLLQNGTGENAQDVIEAFKYTFSKPGNHFSPQKYHDLDIHTHKSIFGCDQESSFSSLICCDFRCVYSSTPLLQGNYASKGPRETYKN